MIRTSLDAVLDYSAESWTRKINPQTPKRPLGSAHLIRTARPPITSHELRLISETVHRVSDERKHCQRAAAEPIDASGLPLRRRITLMSISVAVMNERGLKRWSRERTPKRMNRRS